VRGVHELLYDNEHIVTVEEAALRAAAVRDAGGTVVTTNGCFDILHAGHVASIEAAKALGDLLVVGVNVDRTITILKGPGRPVNPLEERLRVLAGLRAVDLVCPFEEETSLEFVRAIKPHIHVKGGDYSIEDLPEYAVVSEYGGRVELTPLMGGRSTTRLLERIGELLDSGLLP